MSTTEQNDKNTRDIRNAYRKLYTDATGENHLATRDRYAYFMAEVFGDKHTNSNYGREWAHRFYTGTHWHKMDQKNRMAYLKVLTRDIDGTAACISVADMADAILELLKEEPKTHAYSVEQLCEYVNEVEA